jgi:hypothetical protein
MAFDRGILLPIDFAEGHDGLSGGLAHDLMRFRLRCGDQGGGCGE